MRRRCLETPLGRLVEAVEPKAASEGGGLQRRTQSSEYTAWALLVYRTKAIACCCTAVC